MGLLDIFRRTPPPQEAKGTSLNQIITNLSSQYNSDAGVIVNEHTALRVAAAQACLALIANDVAALPLKVKRQSGDRLEDATDRPEYSLLLRKPNDLHTGFEFRQMMTAQAVLRGNAYAYISRAANNRITELWPLMASEVSVTRRGYDLEYTVAAYDGQLSGTFTKRNILHLRGLMWDGKGGLDRILTARDSIGLASAAEGTQAKAFKNGARMPGYWTTDVPLKPEQVDRIAAQLLAATTGENQYKSPVLDAGMKFNQAGMNFDDAQLVETRKQQILEVCAHFNVVPAVLGLDDKTQAFTSVEAMMRWHLQHTLRPWLTAWEQAIDRDVLDGAAGPLIAKFDTSDMEKASTAERAQSYRDLVELGIMTRNEARRLEGLPALDGLDEPLTPLNMAGADQGGGADAPES